MLSYKISLTFFIKSVYICFKFPMQEMKLSVDAFNQVIRKCRCKETSADPEGRSQDNPSHMHCFTTAVLLFETL